MKNSLKTLLNRKVIFSVMFLLTLTTGLLNAQENMPVDTTRNNALKVFIDCQVCDMNFIRVQMPYINYVRDTREAQVYLLVTRQATGSGGGNYTIFYSGQQEFAGMKDTLMYTTNPDATQDISRTGLTNTMAIGLMRYVAKTPLKANVMINYQTESQRDEPEEVVDKWNNWVFTINTRPDMELEKSQQSYAWMNSFTVNRVTADWKLQNSFSQSYDKSIYIRERFDDDLGMMVETKTTAIRKGWNFNNLTVKSLTGHWSTGIRASAQSSSFSNIDLQARIAPSIEYDIFPYSVSNQKQLRILYGVGYVYNKYVDTTVYNMTKENLFEQTLDIAFQVQQKWGSANLSFGYAAYLNDLSKNNVSFDANLRIRILKGLSFNLNGGVAFIHNQIELAKGDRSAEDVYLRLSELETNYRYEAGVGLTYTFGSIYNNVVNPRFGGGGGFSGGQGGGDGGGYNGPR